MHLFFTACLHRNAKNCGHPGSNSSCVYRSRISQAALLCTLLVKLAVANASQTPVLTHENGSFTIFDSQRHEHVFHPDNNGHLRAMNPSSGTFTALPHNRYLWADNTGRRYVFNGSRSVPDECTPANPDTADTDAENTMPHTDDDKQCDTETQGNHIFQPAAYSGPLTTLDARPQSCSSYFIEYYGTERGSQIEQGLNHHAPYNGMMSTIRTFPVIDFMDEDSMYVVHSRDLGSQTFNSPSDPDALLNQLLDDGQEVQERFVDVLHNQGSISASELGQSTTITLEQLKPITMQLVIRDGMASSAHWQQIETAREQLMTLYGITLEIVIIP